MGTYGLSAEEIKDEIISAIEDAEGDFDVKTLNEAWKLATKEKNKIRTIDRELCNKCGKTFKIKITYFKCPHCGHYN